MDQSEVYQWGQQIRERLGLGHWQAHMLSGLSLGIVAGRNCTLSTIAEQLGCLGKADSVERRIQRWLNNSRIETAQLQVAWTRWVLEKVDQAWLTLLVDETKLGEHLSVMMVGLAYRQRCLGLAWSAYRPDSPRQDEAQRIERLLSRVKSALPAGVEVLVQADRGLGTSPELVKVVLKLGWHYLFRVQAQTHFQSPSLGECELAALIQRGGEPVSAAGWVFKKAGWLPSHIHLLWDAPFDEAWCLISDLPDLDARAYGQRNWQEQGFRDLKSGGWRWNASQVWRPDHAERLLLALVLAYALILSLGLRTVSDPHLKRNVSRGKRQRWSLFRLGLRVLADLRRRAEPVYFFLDLALPLLDYLPSG